MAAVVSPASVVGRRVMRSVPQQQYAMDRQRSRFAVTAVLIGVLASGCSFSKNDELNRAALAGDQARCEVLLSRGANVNGAGMHGMRPVMSAAEGGHLQMVRFLVANGADVNAHNVSGSALMCAVDSDHAEMVRFLILNGAELTWTNSLGETALDHARRRQAADLIGLLEKEPAKDE